MTERELDGRLEKGVSAAGGSLPEELCLTATSMAQGQQQQFECIGSSLSSFVSFTISTTFTSPHPSSLCLSGPVSLTKYVYKPKNRYNKIPAIITSVTSLSHLCGRELVVQLTESTHRCSNDVQKRIEWADSFICSSAHKMKKFSVLLLRLIHSTPPSHSLLLHLLCGGFSESQSVRRWGAGVRRSDGGPSRVPALLGLARLSLMLGIWPAQGDLS